MEIDQLTPPSLTLALSEAPRALSEACGLICLYRLLLRAPRSDGQPVVTLPGYTASDGSMAFLRNYLIKLGYDARPWDLGRNLQSNPIRNIDELLAFKSEMVDKAHGVVEKVHRETGRKVSLVGWSLGGLYADSLGRRSPDIVRQVITMGSPYGDPRGTSIFKMMDRLLGKHFEQETHDFTQWCEDNYDGERAVPTCIIYSSSDGIVSPDIAKVKGNSSIKHLRVTSSHVGFAINPIAYWAVAKELAHHNFD